MFRSDVIASAFFIIFLLLFIIEVSVSQTLSQEEVGESFTYEVEPLNIDEDFSISAELNEQPWKRAPSIFIRHQVMPDDNIKALVDTEVKVLYSSSYLYIAFICEDPSPDRIRAQVSDRDNSFADDFVGVFLDPFGNNQQAYEFFINPLGIQMDGMRTGNNEDMNFDALWYSDGNITDTGYIGVMKIPFKSLNFPAGDIQNWSVQFVRNYPRNNRYQFSWTDIQLDNSCLLCQNGILKNMENIENTRTVEFLPYGISYQTSTDGDPANPASGLDHNPVKARFGGSVSYSPTSTTSLNAVVNPDFSQVETDAAQIGVNETFALYYPEKRPFFMRSADLFESKENLFYSRMINHPLAAGKFTSKGSNYNLAFLSAYDRNAPFVIPGLYGSSLVESDVDAFSNIIRGQYSFGSESFVGGLLTTRNQDQAHNYVGSLDWKLYLGGHYFLTGQAGYSSTREMNDTTLFNNPRTFGNSDFDAAFNGQQYSGTLLSAEFERQAKHYNFSFEYSSYSPEFQTQSGFVNETDRRVFEVNQSISYYPGLEWLSSGSFSINGSWRYDFTGEFQERYLYTRLSNNFGGQTRLSVAFLPVNDEKFRGRLFTKMNRTMIHVNSSPSDLFSLRGSIDFGHYIRRTSNPEKGKGYNLSAGATLKPGSRLNISLDYSHSTLSSIEGEEFYSGNIFRINSRFNFSKNLFTRIIAQYDSFNDQIQIYPLVYYEINPFTKFYIGMTDYLSRYPDQPGEFNGYHETSREFFIKFQYLIRS